MEEIIIKLPEILAKVASAGIPGLIGASILLLVFVFGMFKYNKMKKEAAEERDRQARNRDQAGNAPGNSNASGDAEQAEEDIEEIINGK